MERESISQLFQTLELLKQCRISDSNWKKQDQMKSLPHTTSKASWKTEFLLSNPYKNIPNSFYCHRIQDLTSLLKDVYPQSFDCVIRIVLAYNFHALFTRHSTYTNDHLNTIFTNPLKNLYLPLPFNSSTLSFNSQDIPWFFKRFHFIP